MGFESCRNHDELALVGLSLSHVAHLVTDRNAIVPSREGQGPWLGHFNVVGCGLGAGWWLLHAGPLHPTKHSNNNLKSESITSLARWASEMYQSLYLYKILVQQELQIHIASNPGHTLIKLTCVSFASSPLPEDLEHERINPLTKIDLSLPDSPGKGICLPTRPSTECWTQM